MVKVWYNFEMTEVPAEEMVAGGIEQLFSKISGAGADNEQDNIQDFTNYRLLYNDRILKDADLKMLVDDDAVQVFVVADEIKKESRAKVTEKCKKLALAFRKIAHKKDHSLGLLFSEPSHMSKLLRNNPELLYNPQLLPILKSWPLFKAYILKDAYHKDPERNEFKLNPDFLPFIQQFIPALAKSFGVKMVEERGVASVVARPTQSNIQITQAQLQERRRACFQALHVALASLNVPGTSTAVPSPPAAPPAPVVTNEPTPPEVTSSSTDSPARQEYAEQAAALRSFGFVDEEMIQLALEQTDGDVGAAVDFLITLLS